MKMNSLSGLLKRAQANISIATQALDARNPYEAGESFDELESVKMSIKSKKLILEITGCMIVEDFAIDDMIVQIENMQSQLETMIDQLGEDFDYKNLTLEGE